MLLTLRDVRTMSNLLAMRAAISPFHFPFSTQKIPVNAGGKEFFQWDKSTRILKPIVINLIFFS